MMLVLMSLLELGSRCGKRSFCAASCHVCSSCSGLSSLMSYAYSTARFQTCQLLGMSPLFIFPSFILPHGSGVFFLWPVLLEFVLVFTWSFSLSLSLSLLFFPFHFSSNATYRQRQQLVGIRSLCMNIKCVELINLTAFLVKVKLTHLL